MKPAADTPLPCGCTPPVPPAAAPSPAVRPRPAGPGLDRARIRAITLDLDDTLWPVWPTIARAERALREWLAPRAPATAALSAQAETMRELRQQVQAALPHLAHDLSAIRRELIRRTLQHTGEDAALAEPAFEVFFAERQRVQFFHDALPALDWLAGRYPVVALSNGNADLQRVGIAGYFVGGVSMRSVGVGKPHGPIFEAAARVAGVAPQAILHVGDDAHLDAVGALAAGRPAAWVTRDGQDWPHDPLVPHVTVGDLSELCQLLQAAPPPVPPPRRGSPTG